MSSGLIAPPGATSGVINPFAGTITPALSAVTSSAPAIAQDTAPAPVAMAAPDPTLTSASAPDPSLMAAASPPDPNSFAGGGGGGAGGIGGAGAGAGAGGIGSGGGAGAGGIGGAGAGGIGSGNTLNVTESVNNSTGANAVSGAAAGGNTSGDGSDGGSSSPSGFSNPLTTDLVVGNTKVPMMAFVGAAVGLVFVLVLISVVFLVAMKRNKREEALMEGMGEDTKKKKGKKDEIDMMFDVRTGLEAGTYKGVYGGTRWEPEPESLPSPPEPAAMKMEVVKGFDALEKGRMQEVNNEEGETEAGAGWLAWLWGGSAKEAEKTPKVKEMKMSKKISERDLEKLTEW